MQQFPLTLLRIEMAVAAAAGISIEDLRSRSRNAVFAKARHAVWYVAFDHLEYTCTRLAELYERDHTTILSGVDKIRDTDEAKVILDGLKKTCPDVFDKVRTPAKSSVHNWSFGPKLG